MRFAHWIIFTAIVSLSITGYYMHSPFVVPHERTAYVMGTMRFVHLLSGFAFLGAILIRVVWMFIGTDGRIGTSSSHVTKKRLKDFVETGDITDLWLVADSPHWSQRDGGSRVCRHVFGMGIR